MALLHYDSIRICALAGAVPANVQIINTTDESNDGYLYNRSFVRQTGVQKRHISLIGQTCTDIGFMAAKKALERAGLTAQDLDGIIFVTQSPDFKMGLGNACIIHNRLQCNQTTFAFDIGMLVQVLTMDYQL